MARQNFVSSSVRSCKPSTAYTSSKQHENYSKVQHAAAQKQCCKVRVKTADLKDSERKALFFGPASMECVQDAVMVGYYEVRRCMTPIQAQWFKRTLYSGQYSLELAAHQPTPAAVQTLQHSSSSSKPAERKQVVSQQVIHPAQPNPCHMSTTTLAQHHQAAALSCTKMATNSSSTGLLSQQEVTQEVMAPAKPTSNTSSNDLAEPQQRAADSCTMNTANSSSNNAAQQQVPQHAEPLSPPMPSKTKAAFTKETPKHTKQAPGQMSLASTIMGLAHGFISWVDFEIEVEFSFNSWY